jgi:hypothetical protein
MTKKYRNACNKREDARIEQLIRDHWHLGTPGIGKSAVVRGNTWTRIKRWLRSERTIDVKLSELDASDMRGRP